MLATDADLPRTLRDTLLACDEFADDAILRALFATAPDLAPWRDRLPQADARTTRVARITAFLLDQPHITGHPPPLSLLLLALSHQRDTHDAQQAILTALAERVAIAPDLARDNNAPTPGPSPYKGLTYFDEPDAALFFGRETLTAELVARLRTPDQRFLAVVGASGSGKSSLVRAGLVPALRAGALPESARWDMRVITPTVHPLKVLAAMLTRDLESAHATVTLMDDLARDPRTLDLTVARVLARGPGAPRLLLVVDQFEETFTLCKDDGERSAFIAALLHATAPETGGPLVVVLTLRADFYAHCAQYADLRAALTHQQEYIGPMSAADLRRAIEEPARQGGWDFELGLVDLLLREVGDEPGALPLLAHALLETWQRRAGRMLTLAGYQASGGVRGAIAQTAERVFATLTPDSQVIARDIFLRLTELGEGAQDTRRRVMFAELAPRTGDQATVNAVLKTLADARLITTDTTAAEVSHEALIREWGRLRNWLDEDRDGLRIHRHLTESAQAWIVRGRDVGELYRGARLAQVREWATKHGEELNVVEREFLAAAQEAVEREAQRQRALDAEREAHRQRELDTARALASESEARRQAEATHAHEAVQAATRLRVRNRIALIFALVAGVAALTAGWLFVTANQAREEAVAQAKRARAGELVVQANSMLSQNFSIALLLSVEASLHLDTATSRVTLLDAVRYNPIISETRWLTGHGSEVLSVVFSPNRAMLASGGGNGTIILWDVAAGDALGAPLTGHTNKVLSVTFNPDGSVLASGSGDGTIILWDVATRKALGVLSNEHGGGVGSVAFSPDGSMLASGSGDGTIILWDVATRKVLSAPLIGHASLARSVAFSPDGSVLASGSGDGTIILWDVATRKALDAPLIGHAGGVRSVAFSPDGATLASGSWDGTVRLWKVATGQALGAPLTGHTDWVGSVAFSPDGAMLASGSGDGTIRLWEVATGKALGAPLTGRTGAVSSVAFSLDGAMLASGSGDGTIILWKMATGRAVGTPLSGHTNGVSSVAFSPDGAMLASGSGDGTIRLWEVATGRAVGTPLSGHADWVLTVAFSPDGAILASGSRDGTIRLWEVATGKVLGAPLTGHTDEVESVVFSPDGAMLASGSGDGTIRLWEVATGSMIGTPLTGHAGRVSSVAFSPDGAMLASGSWDGTIRLWEVATGRAVGTPLTEHADWVLTVAFSPDGAMLASGSWDGTIRLWEVATGRAVGTPLTGHLDWVGSVAFSPDGAMLASGSGDGTIRLWEVATGRAFSAPLTGHTSGVQSVAFSPDGATLASGSGDGTVILWGIGSHALRARACAIAGRNLTRSEWAQYLYDKPYPTSPESATCPQWPLEPEPTP